MSKVSAYHKAVWAFALGLLVVLLVHIMDYRASEELIESFEEVETIQEVILRLEETRSLVKDVQRSHRGYIISEDKDFLAPYYAAKLQIPVLLTQLEADFGQHTSQQAKFVALKQLIDKKIDFADVAINQVQQGNREQALREIGEGKAYFDELNLLLDQIKEREIQHLAQVRQQANYFSDKNRAIVLLALLSSGLLLAYALWRIAKDIRQKKTLQEQLTEANNDLVSYNEELITLNHSLSENQNKLLEVQQELQKSEEQLLEAQAISKTGSFDWRMGEQKVYYTREYARIFRIAEGEEYSYKVFLDRLHPDDRARVDRVVTEAIKDNRPYKIEYRLQFPDQIIHVQVNAKPYYLEDKPAGIFGTVADITAFKETQARLQEQETQFRALLESAPDAMVIINEVGLIELANLQAEQLFGFSKEEMIQQPIEIILPERYLAVYQSYHTYSIKAADKAKRVVQEVGALKSNGEEIPVEISLSPIITPKAVLIAAAIRDITQRKATEQLVQEANLALEKANTELNTFSYSISHDLRAPLRAISGYSAILKEEYGQVLGEKGVELAEIIRKNANRMGSLIVDLLEFAKLGKKAIKKTPFNMQELVQQALADKSFKAGTELYVAAQAQVKGDPVLLRQVWENLISNAIKFSRNQPIPKIEISYVRETNRHVFCVQDNGTGFDPEYAQDLFVVFKRLHADTTFEGTGAGLAIVKRIVEGHSGEVWANAKPNEGATFCFSLPLEE